MRRVADLGAIPLFVRAGGILPVSGGFGEQEGARLASGCTDAMRADRIEILVYPGADGNFVLYEDDGVSEDYRTGQSERTAISSRLRDDGTWELRVAPVAGRCDVLPRSRAYVVRFAGSRHPDRVTVDGVEWREWCYEDDHLDTVVSVPSRSKDHALVVTLHARGGISVLGDALTQHRLFARCGSGP